MKKALGLILCFMTSFIITLYFTLPYDHIYQHFFKKMAFQNHIHLTYKLIKARALSLKAKDIKLNISKQPIDIDQIQIKAHPIGYLIGKDFLSVYIYEKGNLATLNCQKKDGHFLVNGVIPVSVLQKVLKDQPLLKLLQGKIRVHLSLKRQAKQIVIDKLQIRDAINIDAKGYLKNNFIVLKGRLVYQGIKRSFSYSGRI